MHQDVSIDIDTAVSTQTAESQQHNTTITHILQSKKDKANTLCPVGMASSHKHKNTKTTYTVPSGMVNT